MNIDVLSTNKTLKLDVSRLVNLFYASVSFFKLNSEVQKVFIKNKFKKSFYILGT